MVRPRPLRILRTPDPGTRRLSIENGKPLLFRRTMTLPSNQELIDTHQSSPAPLLPLLHAFHDRDGYLSEEALRAVSKGLRIPIADLYGTVTFYHHFARRESDNGTSASKSAPRVCTGPVCCLQGGREILDALKKKGATPMPCAGRCDEPVPVLLGDDVLVGRKA